MFAAGFTFILGALAAFALVAALITWWRYALILLALAVVIIIGLIAWVWVSQYGHEFKAFGIGLVVVGLLAIPAKWFGDWREDRRAREKARELADVNFDWNAAEDVASGDDTRELD